MMNKKDYFQFSLFKQFLNFSIHSPYFIYNFIISILSPFLLFSFKKFYRIAMLNIIMCLKKTISPQQKHQLINQSLQFCFISLRHLYFLLKFQKTPRNLNISFINKNFLEDIKKKFNSAIIATAHFGLFPLIPLFLSKENYNIDVVIKPPHNQYFKTFVFSYMQENNIGIIPATPELSCFKLINNSIKNNRLIMLMIDQIPLLNQSKLFIKFFEWDTLTYPTIPELAKKNNLPIIPIFTYYEVKGNLYVHTIKIYEAINPHKENKIILEELNKLLEELILEFPWQWWWFHKRWKNLIDYDDPKFYKFAVKETNDFLSNLYQKCESSL